MDYRRPRARRRALTTPQSGVGARGFSTSLLSLLSLGTRLASTHRVNTGSIASMALAHGCTPNLDGSATAGCAAFCDAKYADVHCSFCSCTSCSFCSSRVIWSNLGAPCALGKKGEEQACEEWCDGSKAGHCDSCQCAACRFCSEHSAVASHMARADVALAQPPRPFSAAASAPPLSRTAEGAAEGMHCHTGCNPAHGADCDKPGCHGCPFCHVLKKRGAHHVTLDECGWLSSMHDMRSKNSFCYVYHNTTRQHCESNVISMPAPGTSASGNLASCVFGSSHSRQDCLWQRCIWSPPTDDQTGGTCAVGVHFGCSAQDQALSPPPPPATCTPANVDDVNHVACLSWCVAQATETHCTYCACQGCGFCTTSRKSIEGARAPVSTPTKPTCAEAVGGRQDARQMKPPRTCAHFSADADACKRHYVRRDVAGLSQVHLCTHNANPAEGTTACAPASKPVACKD